METRTLDPAHVDAALDVRSRSFGVLTAVAAERWMRRLTREIEANRVLAVYDGAQVVAVARIMDLTQWWGGKSMPMAGVGGVVVSPEHRGRGVGSQLMTGVLERGRLLGYPLSALYPATVPVYRGVGYEFAGVEQKIIIKSADVRELGRRSTVELRRATADDATDLIQLVSGLHERHRDCGPIMWSEAEWAAELKNEDNYAYVAHDGFLMYGWDGSGGLQVHTIIGGSPETLRAFWSILGSGSSVATTISAVVSPHDPIRWLLHDQGMVSADPEWWMLRLLDVGAAIAGRGFPLGVTVDLPLEITDDQIPANTGRFRLTVADGEAGIEADRTTRPVVELNANALAALYAGTPISTLRCSGLVVGGRSDDDAVLDAAFAARPFMLDYF